MSYLYLGSAIILEVIATTALKASDGFTKLVPNVITAVGYAASFYFLSLTLKTMPTGIAYAIWAGCGVVLISLASWLIYGQRLDLAAIGGMALIVAGVMVINLLSKSSAH